MLTSGHRYWGTLAHYFWLNSNSKNIAVLTQQIFFYTVYTYNMQYILQYPRLRFMRDTFILSFEIKWKSFRFQ